MYILNAMYEQIKGQPLLKKENVIMKVVSSTCSHNNCIQYYFRNNYRYKCNRKKLILKVIYREDIHHAMEQALLKLFINLI